MYNHHANANELWYELLNDTPGRVGPPIKPPPADIRQYFRDWMDRDGHPFWPFWENVRTWWEIRDLPNVLFVHFANLKRDMPGQMRRIAEFLDIPIDETRWEETLEYCSFDWMKRNAPKSVPLGGAFWDAGAQVFINKGTNGRWTDTLTRRGRGRVRSARRGGTRPRMRALARDGRGTLGSIPFKAISLRPPFASRCTRTIDPSSRPLFPRSLSPRKRGAGIHRTVQPDRTVGSVAGRNGQNLSTYIDKQRLSTIVDVWTRR